MKVPNTSWKIRKGPDWWDETAEGYFKGKRVLVVSLPGAFTPTWSSEQIPGLEEIYEKFKEKGIDEIFCVSVNDSFVMNAWAKDIGIKKVKMITDGNGELTRDMDMLVFKPAQNVGYRTWRYALVINDMAVEKMLIEEGKNQMGLDEEQYEVTKHENILNNLI